jgi:sialic acid synthase SpsE
MLRELGEHFDHLVVSTGATFDEEVAKAARTVQDVGKKLTFLHCVTSYPNTLEVCNLARMRWLRQFTDSVGWSDHTLVARDGLSASKAAIALGATWIERHFTILEAKETKDGPVSIRPEHLRELRSFAALPPEEQLHIAQEDVPAWEDLLGSETRAMTATELLNRDYYRGRFASRVGDHWVMNWEEQSVFANAVHG